MTKLIGLTGPAGSGKDTVADFLVAKHGFTKLAFADKLRAEICDAYDVPVQLLLERQTKDTPLPKLALVYCRDEAFIDWFLHTGYIYGKHGGGLAPALFTPHARSLGRPCRHGATTAAPRTPTTSSMPCKTALMYCPAAPL